MVHEQASFRSWRQLAGTSDSDVKLGPTTENELSDDDGGGVGVGSDGDSSSSSSDREAEDTDRRAGRESDCDSETEGEEDAMREVEGHVSGKTESHPWNVTKLVI